MQRWNGASHLVYRITTPSPRNKGLYVEPLWMQDARAESLASERLLEAIDELVHELGRQRTKVLLCQAVAAL